MTRRVIHTDRAPARPGFSQAVVAGNLLFVSGTVGMDMMTGAWPSGIEAQGEQALNNLEAVLIAAGCSFDDVVKVTMFVTDVSDAAKIAGAYSRAFPAPPPARSTPVVSGFPMPEALISIEAVALIPPVAGGPRTFDPTNQ